MGLAMSAYVNLICPQYMMFSIFLHTALKYPSLLTFAKVTVYLGFVANFVSAYIIAFLIWQLKNVDSTQKGD